MKHRCAQRGCEFEADALPDNCPVCNNPMVEADQAGDDWNDLTVAQLKEWAREFGLSGYSRKSKSELVAMIEAAEAEDGEGDDD